ncbi:hypothetical protein Ancab_012234 [Ancistrocladus abbreviatus]
MAKKKRGQQSKSKPLLGLLLNTGLHKNNGLELSSSCSSQDDSGEIELGHEPSSIRDEIMNKHILDWVMRERQRRFGPLRGHRSYKDVVADYQREAAGMQKVAMKSNNTAKLEPLKVVAWAPTGKTSDEHSDKLGKAAVGSWTSVIPCTLDGRPCNDCFDSPEKVKVLDQAQSQPSSGSHDDGLRNRDVAQDYSRKVVHVSHAETSSNAGNRDALHVLASGTLLEDAFKEDMRGSPGKSEKGTPSGTTAGGSPFPGMFGGPNNRCVGKALVASQYAEPTSGPNRDLKASESRPKVAGPKKKNTAKKSKKVTMDMISPSEKGKGGFKCERNRAAGRKGSEQLSGVSLGDSNIANMNRVILEKMKIEEATAIWETGKRLGVQSTEEEQVVIHRIAQRQG